jgi:hypothetical protein
MEVMTNEEKELVGLFRESLGTLPSADEASSPTSIPSVNGNEDYKVNSEVDEEEDGVYSWRDACGHRKGAAEIIDVPYNVDYFKVTFQPLLVVAKGIKQARSEHIYYRGAVVGDVVPT